MAKRKKNNLQKYRSILRILQHRSFHIDIADKILNVVSQALSLNNIRSLSGRDDMVIGKSWEFDYIPYRSIIGIITISSTNKTDDHQEILSKGDGTLNTYNL